MVNSFDQPILDDDRMTLAELLRGQGYRTACIGKWHLGWDWKSIQRDPKIKANAQQGYAPEAFDWSRPIAGGPLSHGFDYYFGDDVPNFPPYAWFENDRLVAPPTVTMNTKQQTAEGSFETRPGPGVAHWDFYAVMPKLTEKAVQWIEQQSPDQPFFLYVPMTSPHAPIVPTDEFRSKSSAGGYGDFMMQTDAAVGQILAVLNKQGLTENTIVIFTSDNGPETYAYARIKNHGHRSMGPFRGLKRDLWEGGHRVPMIVRWPGHVPASRVSDELLSQIDLYATIAAIVGVEIPLGNAEDSYNQQKLLTATGPSVRSELVHNTNANGYALRQDDWVLIAAKSGGVSQVPDWFNESNGYQPEDTPEQLYQLSSDPAQKKNQFSERPDLVEKMKARLQAIRASGQVR